VEDAAALAPLVELELLPVVVVAAAQQLLPPPAINSFTF
jgi:hypothetical protein